METRDGTFAPITVERRPVTVRCEIVTPAPTQCPVCGAGIAAETRHVCERAQ